MTLHTTTWIGRLPYKAELGWSPDGTAGHPWAVVFPTGTVAVTADLAARALYEKVEALLALTPVPRGTRLYIEKRLTEVSDQIIWTEAANRNPLQTLLMSNPLMLRLLNEEMEQPAAPSRQLIRAMEVEVRHDDVILSLVRIVDEITDRAAA